ncbi:MAG: aspartate kinase, partial [Clostridia bacterium]|nr:aspartate kinase [Clostridia bacterium]
ASRGEYLSAMMFAEFAGFEFVDAYSIVAFDDNGAYNAEYSNDLVARRLALVKGKAVIPGFYGSMPGGEIKTFSRGGSDVTGAVVARAVKAAVYENWTDVSGFMVSDPRIVENAKIMKQISYRELRELSYMGANVLHPESIFPVRQAGIPINIKNTFRPEDEGTMICANIISHERLVTGIAGKKNFTSIYIEKSMMNNEVGFARKMLSVLERCGISFEHVPSGIDTMSVVIADSELGSKLEKLLEGIREAVSPDKIEIVGGLSLIATVGHGMSFKPGTAARLFSALSRHGVNIRMIDQGSSEMNIIVAVANEDYEKAINAIYEEFIN